MANLTSMPSNYTTLLSTEFNPVNFFFTHIYLLLLVIIGCIGNGFVIIIFGQRALRTTVGTTMSVYPFLFYMAISDTMYLSVLFCLWLTNYINILHHPIICQSSLYLTYVCNFINAYYTVAFTAQRLFAVTQPIRVSYVLSWYRSRCLALCIVLIACLIYSYIPFIVGIVGGYCYSYEKFRKLNAIMDIIDCLIVFLIPYMMIITMNAIILISLRRMRNSQHQLLFQTNNSQLKNFHVLTRCKASRSMTKLLLTVSTSYLIVCAPYACIHTWRLLSNDERFQTKFFKQLEHYFHLIYHISFAMNFYIYIFFGSKFRRELRRFLIKCQIKMSHYFETINVYDNDTSINPTNSLNYEQFQLIRQPTASSIRTTGSFTIGYRWKQPQL
ncbi:unnamed protein product [Adineta ricciae]|uniref:G-protein coupled receptors family 1 profile domain-containing protein n=1 Tax=Adineta ricciae TaxID=249248 RepID=A0A815CEQ4_ADIRI|nr:unnamed protein product [Adineta ricciae]CAF1347323.1 unnamed protein product [Adineta ricciae]